MFVNLFGSFLGLSKVGMCVRVRVCVCVRVRVCVCVCVCVCVHLK
jgi:hypothetical protein